MAAYINNKISVFFFYFIFSGIREAIFIDNDELLQSVYGPDVPYSPATALMHYRNEHFDSNRPSQSTRWREGSQERDFWVLQKPQNSHESNSKSVIWWRGCCWGGPVRAFLTQAIKVKEEGFPFSGAGKPITFFEGEPDHRIAVHGSTLRLTGSFKTVGRIIFHSVLQGGPSLTGLSPAIKHCLSHASDNEAPTVAHRGKTQQSFTAHNTIFWFTTTN